MLLGRGSMRVTTKVFDRRGAVFSLVAVAETGLTNDNDEIGSRCKIRRFLLEELVYGVIRHLPNEDIPITPGCYGGWTDEPGGCRTFTL